MSGNSSEIRLCSSCDTPFCRYCEKYSVCRVCLGLSCWRCRSPQQRTEFTCKACVKATRHARSSAPSRKNLP